MSNSNFILDEITKEIRAVEVDGERIETILVSEIQEKIHELFIEKKYEKLSGYIKELQKKYNVKLKKAGNYVEVISARAWADPDDKKIDLDDGIYQGIRERVREHRRQIFTLDRVKISYEEIKQLLRTIIKQEFDESKEEIIQNRFIFPFIIANNSTLRGDIILKTTEHAQSVVLLSVGYRVRNSVSELIVKFLGEKTRHQNLISYSEKFYVYTFIDDNRQSFLIFSREPIPEGHCKIDGMLVNMPDEIKIGTSATTATNLPVLFATNVKSDEELITFDDFKKFTKDWDREKISDMIFGEAKHPLFFEKFVMSWLFSGKFSEYPLHIGWIGPTGSGKTIMEIALMEMQMGEHRWDGTTSTSRSLLPSYGASQIEPGYVMRQRRVGAVDEFFSGFVRSSKKDRSFGEDSALLTSLLEHKKVSMASGRHAMIFGKARAKFIFCSNPETSRLSTLSDCAKNLPRQFLSRFLWYVQTKSHVDMIKQNQPKIERMGNEKYPVADRSFLRVFDYLNSFTVEIPIGTEDEIYKKYKDTIPDELLLEVYIGRTHHHILCIIDGIAKLNSIFEKREKISCTPQDVREADVLFGMIISSWNSNVELLKLDPEIRCEYMPGSAQFIFDIICKNHDLTRYGIEKISKMSATMYWLTYLQENKLIKSYPIEEGGKKKVRYLPYYIDVLQDCFTKPKQ